LRRHGVKPTLVIVERCNASLADEAERKHIARRRAEGHDLTNSTDGGGGIRGWRHDAKTRAKIGAVHRGKYVSEETRARISASKQGWRLSPEHKAKLLACARRPISREARLAISERMRGNRHALGCKRSEETLRRMAVARAGEKSLTATISNDEAQLIRDLYEVGLRQRDIARLLGLTTVLVHRVVRRKTFKIPG
jgi:hypothetical protein